MGIFVLYGITAAKALIMKYDTEPAAKRRYLIPQVRSVDWVAEEYFLRSNKPIDDDDDEYDW